MPASYDLAYDLVLLFWRAVISIFFREVRPRGAHKVPRKGPVIFVAGPHHNQFLDPLLLASEVLRETGRPLSFLIAEKSMRRKFIGLAARSMHSIPVVRAADSAVAGTGTLYLSPSPSSSPTTIHGHNTRFLSELEPKKLIALPSALGGATVEVVEVVSDTEVRVRKEFGKEAARGALEAAGRAIEGADGEEKVEGATGVKFKVLPHVDQERMYRSVYRKLKEGGCIGIFPEGGSHDRTDLLPLKAGVTIMALGAMSADPSLRVQIVPVGLSYFHAHKFRSRAVVEFGSPRDVPLELVKMFEQGGAHKREACGKLLEQIYDGLKSVTVRSPDYETLMVVQAGRRLYQTPGQHLTLGQVVELNKRLIAGYLKYQDEPKVKQLRARIHNYNRLLQDLGLKDHQVERASTTKGWKGLGLLFYRVGLLAAWSLLALPGTITHAPIFITAKIISHKKAKEALAASTVKVKARDVLATWKVLVSLALTPLLYVFYVLLATYLVRRTFADALPPHVKFWAPFWVAAALPFLGVSALKFGEVGMDVYKSLPPLFVSLLPGNERVLAKLKQMRQDLSNELSETINEFGPQLYEDFDKHRVLPATVPPPSTGRPGLWRRKSGVGAVDAQGQLLSHPLQWLDERLFGWSRSARTARYVGLKSETTSETGASPIMSDSEEDESDPGDFDEVVGYLDAASADGRPRSRSRSGSAAANANPNRRSYADLTRLRAEAGLPTSPVLPNSPNSPSSRLRSRSDLSLTSLAGGGRPRSGSKSGSTSGTASPRGGNGGALYVPTSPLSPASTSKPLAPEAKKETSPAATTSALLDANGGEVHHRPRKTSLTGTIPLERIAAVTGVEGETFQEATAELNAEAASNGRELRQEVELAGALGLEGLGEKKKDD